MKKNAQNIDCKYMLEPPQLGGSNMCPQTVFKSKNKKRCFPCKPQVNYIKVECKGVFITRVCYHDDRSSKLLILI